MSKLNVITEIRRELNITLMMADRIYREWYGNTASVIPLGYYDLRR